MSAQGEYYGVERVGDKWIAMYDIEQHLAGQSFDTEQEAWDFVKADTVEPLSEEGERV